MQNRIIGTFMTGLALLGSASEGRADVVHFLDGRDPVEGSVVRDDGRTVVVDIGTGRLTFERRDVDRVEKKNWRPPTAPKPPSPAPVPEPRPSTPAAPTPTPAPQSPPPGLAAPTTPVPTPDSEAEARRAATVAATAKVKALLPRLSSAQRDERRAAIAAVARLGQPAAVPMAELAARKELPADVRLALLVKLQSYADPATLPALTMMLDEVDLVAELRAQAIETVAGLGPAAAPLRSRLLGFLTAADAESRVNAVYALARLGDATVPALLAQRLSDPSPNVRRAIVSSLRPGLPESEAALASVRTALDSGDEGVRADALRVLASLNPRDYTILSMAQSDAAPSVREVALSALGSWDDPSSIEACVQALGDPSDGVLMAAAGALGRRRAPEAILPLIDGVRGRSGSASDAVFTALSAITGQNLPGTAQAWRQWWYEGGGSERFAGGGQ